jgi:hypothetical protein
LKIDRYIKDISDRLNSAAAAGANIDHYDEQYYLDIESEPPRFADYRAARAKITDTFGNKTCEDVLDSITQDESDYYLKMNLRISPEERYQHKKDAWYFHESSWCMRHNNGYDGHGCNNGECVPECRYYPEFGRIEDEEFIHRHKEIEERYRNRNALSQL